MFHKQFGLGFVSRPGRIGAGDMPLFLSLDRKDQRESTQSIVNVELDSSLNIHSSIECLKLGNFESDISAADKIEQMETDSGPQEGETLGNENFKGENRIEGNDRSIRNRNDKERERVCESWHFENKEESDSNHKNVQKKFTGEQIDDLEATKKLGDCRNSLSTSSRGKNLSRGSSPKKLNKKLTAKRSPKRSPMKEKESRHSSGRSERRNILADAAERRMHLVVTTPSEPVEQEAAVSPDIFDDDDDNKMVEETGITWRGSPLACIAALSASNLNVPAVHPAPDHTVMVRLPIPQRGSPAPHPSSYTDVWDQYHVRMPCSPKSQYPVGKGSNSLVPRWSIICQSLRRGIGNVEELERAVLEYNSRYAAKWKFKGLHLLIEQEFEEEEREYFFSTTLPAMIRLALNLPKLVTQPPPLLISRATHTITLSQMQIASLLANAFFCTFPRRNAKGSETEYSHYPDINFNRLFFHKEKRALEKMKCILNYFRRVTEKEPSGSVTFTRQFVSYQDLPKWETASQHLPRFHIDTIGLIEEASGLLQADFANKFLGGGVLGLGCVQEEIRFVLSPELLVSRLFTEALEKTEALIITGAEQFNRATGYASTFSWAGSFDDCTPVDTWGRRMCQVVAIDALHFTKQPQVQYSPSFVIRELNKAYAGFCVLDRSAGTPIGVATGNWGCGAFKGDPRLKSLIQLAVCGYVGRDVAYFTFGDQKLRNDLATMYIFLKENNITVGELVQALVHYGSRKWSEGSDLFQYIYHNLGAYESETDNETEDFAEPLVDKNRRNDLPTTDSSHTRPKTGRNITDYFKKSDKTSLSSSAASTHSATFHHSSTSKQTVSHVTPSGAARKESLSEDKILQVLSECDRLVGDQRMKCHETSDSGSGVRTTSKHADQDKSATRTHSKHVDQDKSAARTHSKHVDQDKSSARTHSKHVDQDKSAARTHSKHVTQDKEEGCTASLKTSKRDDHVRDKAKNQEINNSGVCKSSSEPSRLLSYLDDIDKGLAL
nr:poly(ADP-ribose) glycohydrolase-like isoform X1 [Procambarus clarkii]